MTISSEELESLLERLTRLTEPPGRIVWKRLSSDVLQLELPEFSVELARLSEGGNESYRLSVQTREGLPEGALEDRSIDGVRGARIRRDLGYLFDIAMSDSVSNTAARLFSQLPEIE